MTENDIEPIVRPRLTIKQLCEKLAAEIRARATIEISDLAD